MQKGRKSLKDEIASLVSETVRSKEMPDPDAEGYEDGPRIDSDFDEEFVDVLFPLFFLVLLLL